MSSTSVFSRITSLIEEINGREKAASELGTSGSAKKDPGGYQGGSTHPSAKVDSGDQSAPLGSRAKENEKDVKEDHPGGGVDVTPPGAGGDQDSHQTTSGTKVTATGEDPAVEDHYKGTKDDPGTTSPANAEDIGEKYSSMNFEALCKMAYDRMHEVMADLANGQSLPTKQANANQPPAQPGQPHNTPSPHQTPPPAPAPTQPPPTPPPTPPAPGTKQAADETAAAAQAGYDLASLAGNQGLTKEALAHALLSQVISDAMTDADYVGEYLYKFAMHREEMAKQAVGDPIDAAGGEPPPIPGGVPPEMMGGAPPPAAGAAGPDMGGPPGAGGGGGDHAAALEELFNALIEMGMSPDEIMAALQDMGGQGGGGPPGAGDNPAAGGAGGGGGLPGGPGGDEAAKAASARIPEQDRQLMLKLASDVKTAARAGRLRIKEAQPGSQQRRDRDEIKNYIREVCSVR